jgi:predicted DCC family thiol-disulfide oxidoreductase YuxK
MENKKTKIFVDGNCIICDREISHYYRIRPDLFELIDISASDFNAEAYGVQLKDVNDNMHIQTEEGEFRVGVDAFAYIWSRIPRYSFASRAIRLPGIYALSKVGYWIFAKNRHLLPKKK